MESVDWGQGLRVAIHKKVADYSRADSSPINRSMFVGIASIGVGTSHWLGRPSLQTGRADFPHPAIQLIVYLRED